MMDAARESNKAPTPGGQIAGDAGVLYCVTRPAPNALFDCCFSIISLRRVFSGPVTLMTDQPADALQPMARALDLDVRSLELAGGGRHRSRSIKTLLGRLSPYRRSVYLDSDTIILRPIDRLFEVDMGMVLDARSTINANIRYLREVISDILDEEARLTETTVPPDFPQYNGGMIAWRKCRETDHLFETWHQEWLRFKHRDQAALTRALCRTQMNVTPLPREYNFFWEYGDPTDDPKTVIWHACRPADRIQRQFPEIYSETRRFAAKTFEVAASRFRESRVPTEADAYELLRNDPVPEENYVAVPWADLIDKNDLRDRRVRRHLRRIEIDGGFTICQHADYEKIIPVCRRIGVDTLFTPHAVVAGSESATGAVKRLSSRIADRVRRGSRASRPFRVLSFPHVAVNGTEPGSKDTLYSSDETEEYPEILSRTRFSLCPRGAGPGTLRFWESLQAGAIPVLIADDHLLPEGYQWDRCTVRVAEKDMAEVVRVIESIPPEIEATMRSECLKAYALFSGVNLVRCIRLHYDPSADRDQPRGEACAE